MESDDSHGLCRAQGRADEAVCLTGCRFRRAIHITHGYVRLLRGGYGDLSPFRASFRSERFHGAKLTQRSGPRGVLGASTATVREETMATRVAQWAFVGHIPDRCGVCGVGRVQRIRPAAA